jgi:hypothetical protein
MYAKGDNLLYSDFELKAINKTKPDNLKLYQVNISISQTSKILTDIKHFELADGFASTPLVELDNNGNLYFTLKDNTDLNKLKKNTILVLSCQKEALPFLETKERFISFGKDKQLYKIITK